MSEGLELVRIGEPLRPEMAAWRYGDQLGRRRIAAIARTGLGVAVMAAISPFQAVASVVGGFGREQVLSIGDIGLVLSAHRVIGRLVNPDGSEILIRNRHVDDTEMLAPTANKPWGLVLHHEPAFDPRGWIPGLHRQRYETEVRGEEASAIARDILPRLNRHGASRTEINDAVNLIERFPDPQKLFSRTAVLVEKSRARSDDNRATLNNLSSEYRLALEMASQEDLERRALEGELELLEDAWREAEEIAAIADNMFIPRAVLDRLAQLKDRVLR